MSAVVIDPARDRVREKREKFFKSAGLALRISYNGKTPFRPRLIGIALTIVLGIAAERVVLEEIISCLGGPEKAMDFVKNRRDIMRALTDARLYRDDYAAFLLSQESRDPHERIRIS